MPNTQKPPGFAEGNNCSFCGQHGDARRHTGHDGWVQWRWNAAGPASPVHRCISAHSDAYVPAGCQIQVTATASQAECTCRDCRAKVGVGKEAPLAQMGMQMPEASEDVSCAM